MYMYHSNLCFCCHMTIFLLCLCVFIWCFLLCVSVSNFFFLIWTQLRWIRAHANDLILTWIYLQRPYFQLRSHSQVLRIFTSAGILGGIKVQPMTVTILVVQLLACVWLFLTPWTAACQAPLSSTVSQSLLNFMSIELVMLSNHLILFHPLLLLPSILPSIKVFSNELALHFRWPKYWSFSFSISPSNEYSGLISFRID